jgi:uncharacterized membrane protein YidH (DUF202 family)
VSDPADRTQLAWERSALGPLAAAALLLVKQLGPAVGRVLVAAAYVLLALGVIALGRRRNRLLRRAGEDPSRRGTVPDARREVVSSAIAASAVGVCTAVLIAFGTS